MKKITALEAQKKNPNRLNIYLDGEFAFGLARIESLTFARAPNLFACVSDFNDGARAFYRKQGYKEIGPMPNFLIPGYAEILLRKTSGPAKTM